MLYLTCKPYFVTALRTVIYRLKILQQGDSNTEFLSKNLPELLKESLFFKARLVVESFLLKLRTITTYLQLNIFPNQHLWAFLLLALLEVATRIGIHHKYFFGDNFIRKKFQEIVSDEVTF